MRTPDVIRANRVKLRLSQAELARDIAVDTRQINRYETGETEPTLAVARRLAERLQISMDELAGDTAPLNGLWVSVWQGLTGVDSVHTGSAEVIQQGQHVTVRPPRTQPLVYDGLSLIWSAEFYFDRDTLLGGYKVDSPDLTQRGLINLTHEGDAITGTWIRIGLSGAGTGQLCLARNLDIARKRLADIIAGSQA